MSFFYHPDLKSQYFHGQFLSQGIINIYDFLAQNKSSLPYQDTFNYPPLTYFFQGSWLVIAKTFLGNGLVSWLNSWDTSSLFNASMPLYLFWLKLPYLIADLVFCLLLLKAVAQSQRQLAVALWAFNPVSLYCIYMVGQFDILPAVLTFSAFLLMQKRRLALSAILLSLAIAFKTYPLFFLPFVLVRSRSLKELILAGAAFIAVCIVWIAPFISSPHFIASVFQTQLGQRIFAAGIDIGFGEKLPLFIVAYAILLSLSWMQRQRQNLLPEFLFAAASIVVVGHFHAQWAIWSLPFWLVFLAKFPQYLVHAVFAVLAFFGTIFLLPDQFAFISLFIPLNPSFFTIPAISVLVRPFVEPLFLQSMFHASCSGIIIFLNISSWRLSHEK